MDDRHDPNLILGYVEEQLTAADRARVEALLQNDPALAVVVQQMMRDRAALRNARAADLPGDLAESAIATLEREMLFDDDAVSSGLTGLTANTAAPKRFRLIPLVTYGGIAAVLALTATTIIQSLKSDPVKPSQTLAFTEDPDLDLAATPIEAQRQAARGQIALAEEESGRLDDSPAMALSFESDALADANTTASTEFQPAQQATDTLARSRRNETNDSYRDSEQEALALLSAPTDASARGMIQAEAPKRASTVGNAELLAARETSETDEPKNDVADFSSPSVAVADDLVGSKPAATKSTALAELNQPNSPSRHGGASWLGRAERLTVSQSNPSADEDSLGLASASTFENSEMVIGADTTDKSSIPALRFWLRWQTWLSEPTPTGSTQSDTANDKFPSSPPIEASDAP